MRKSIITILFLLSFHAVNSYSQTTPEQIFVKGMEAFYNSDFKQGIIFFNDYIASVSTDYRGYNYRGLCYQSMKNYQRSLEDFTKVIDLANNNWEGYVNRGNSYLKLGNYSSALADYSDAIRYVPDNIEGYLGRSKVYAQQGKYPNALSELNLAVGVDPMNPRVYLSKAWIHILNNDTLSIQNDINTAMYYDSNIVFTDYKRELLFVKVDNYKSILSILNDRVNKFPNSYLAYFSRGVVYFLMNSYDNAVSDLKRSMKLNTAKDQDFVNLVTKILRSIDRNS